MRESIQLAVQKVALVTGASRGIGAAIARELSEAGYAIAAAQRGDAELQEALSIHADLRDPTVPATIVERVIDKYGRLDVLVNNAGATKRGEFLDLSYEDFVDGFALKYYSTVQCTRAAWPHLMESKGVVVNIVGIGAREPGRQFAIGGSVNAAILALTKTLAELGVVDGVRVNAINPGFVLTSRLQTRIDAEMQRTGLDEETVKVHLVAEFGITRLGEPRDVAGLAAFIVSERGSWLQGSLIDIDGGQIRSI